jgi:hypothetical protein
VEEWREWGWAKRRESEEVVAAMARRRRCGGGAEDGTGEEEGLGRRRVTWSEVLGFAGAVDRSGS